jgi:MFS family permease
MIKPNKSAYNYQHSLLLLLLSIGLISFGQGIINTIVSLKTSDQNIGTITSTYYLGMLIGSINSTFLVNKLGAIRTYIIFAFFSCLGSLALGFYTQVPAWYAARFCLGYSLAIAYVVVEHSILTISSNNNRMKFFGLYGVSLYGTGALSQAYLRFLTLDSNLPFYIGAGLCLSAMLPAIMVAIPKTQDPTEVSLSKLIKVYKVLPACIICSFLSGTIIASAYGLLPRHLEDIGMDIKHVADLMTWTMGGAVMLRYPIGYLSDIIGKGRALILSCIILCALCVVWVALAASNQSTPVLMGAILFLFGGLIFTIYPVCTAYLYERVSSDKYNTDIPQGMLLSYSLGCICGPLVISYVVNFSRNYGLFISFTFISAYMIGVLIKSATQKLDKHRG